tara:strand:+ start:10370 stop:10681 length:312 start_codon:yes stop_codon:yes gene_type:complete
MQLKTKKQNRKDIKEIAKNSKQLFDYLIHVCNILIDPPSHDSHEREIHGLKKDLIETLKKIDSNNSKIMGHLDWEEIHHEALSTTFKLDQYYDYNVYIRNNSK